VQRVRGALVFKAHMLWRHSTLGLRVTKKKKRYEGDFEKNRWTLFLWTQQSIKSTTKVNGPIRKAHNVAEFRGELIHFGIRNAPVASQRSGGDASPILLSALSSEHGTNETPTARLCPWLSGESPSNLLSCSPLDFKHGES